VTTAKGPLVVLEDEMVKDGTSAIRWVVKMSEERKFNSEKKRQL